MRRALIAVVCAACGRVGFDASALRDADPTIDGSADSASCTVPAGPTGHWTLDADDISGSTVLDRSGNGHHGIISGTPAPTNIGGRIAEALDFSGTSVSMIEMATLPLNAQPGGFNSISLWFWQDDAQPNQVLFYLPQAAGPQPPRYDLWLNYGAIGVVSLCINAGIGECWGISDPGLIGRWVHVVAVMINGSEDGGRLYVDGIDVNASCRFGACTQVRTAMGPFRTGGDQAVYAWRGKLDDVRVFGRPLTPAEVQQLFACAP